MKVVSLETHIVAVPPPHVGGMYWIFVKLKTDCGIEGVGEIYSATFHPKAMTHIIDDVFGRYLLDKDPHHIERLWREAYSSGFTQRPDLTMMGVVSGLEMACWDIIGKAANKPVYELLGGMVNPRLRSYTYLYPKNSRGEFDYDDPDLAAECAAENVKRGFTAVKFDPAGPYTAYSGHQLSMEVGSRNTIRCGSKNRCRRGRKARWRKSRSTRVFRLPRASA
jgi:galactonate dehydratase